MLAVDVAIALTLPVDEIAAGEGAVDVVPVRDRVLPAGERVEDVVPVSADALPAVDVAVDAASGTAFSSSSSSESEP